MLTSLQIAESMQVQLADALSERSKAVETVASLQVCSVLLFFFFSFLSSVQCYTLSSSFFFFLVCEFFTQTPK